MYVRRFAEHRGRRQHELAVRRTAAIDAPFPRWSATSLPSAAITGGSPWKACPTTWSRIAQELAAAILSGRSADRLAPWRPDRAPIADRTKQEAVEEALVQHRALAAESRLRPPLTGDWPGRLDDAYRHQLTTAYDRLPEGFTLPPELAPLAYEHGPELAELIARHLARAARAAAPARAVGGRSGLP
ncbi:hypothetical protein ACFV1L_04665 [Kitasatospora sp. NPDC059646]|uniref:hypothetical protein n=1 Tax=Kitasatospora sp. NPDC059646 TaxID=3346893 RepID=UPI0036B5140A